MILRKPESLDKKRQTHLVQVSGRIVKTCSKTTEQDDEYPDTGNDTERREASSAPLDPDGPEKTHEGVQRYNLRKGLRKGIFLRKE